MNKNQRVRYHAELWPAACEAQGWNPKDDARRRDIVAQCLVDIGEAGEETGEISSSQLDEAQITALFLFLQHLGSPNHIGLSQEWDNCRAGYVAYHKSKQADWWQRKAYGANGGRRLKQNRFAGRKTARSTPFDIDGPLDEKQAQDRLMTMREHARKKGVAGPKKSRREREPAPEKPTAFATVAAAVGYDAPAEDEPMPF